MVPRNRTAIISHMENSPIRDVHLYLIGPQRFSSSFQLSSLDENIIKRVFFNGKYKGLALNSNCTSKVFPLHSNKESTVSLDFLNFKTIIKQQQQLGHLDGLIG